MISRIVAVLIALLSVSVNGTSIFQDYNSLDDGIKSLLIQTVIDDDSDAFDDMVADLAMDQTKSALLFEAIERIASPQLGPGLAFAQFERKTAFVQNDEIEIVPFENVEFARNIELTATKRIKFSYPGIYRVTVQFRAGSATTEGWCWHAARIIGHTNENVVGRSVLTTSGGYSTVATQSLTFLIQINIGEETGEYVLQFLRNEADTQAFTVPTAGTAFSDWGDTFTYANIMMVVENVGRVPL